MKKLSFLEITIFALVAMFTFLLFYIADEFSYSFAIASFITAYLLVSYLRKINVNNGLAAVVFIATLSRFSELSNISNSLVICIMIYLWAVLLVFFSGFLVFVPKYGKV